MLYNQFRNGKDMEYFKQTFNSVGWFIPPYVTIGFLGRLAKSIDAAGCGFDQQELEKNLTYIYSPEHLSAMISERYPITPYVQDYKEIISEAIEAHFLGLDHVAVSGLMPVIEGAGRQLADSRSIQVKSRGNMTKVFSSLAKDCKNEALRNNTNATGEIVSMMESFIEYTKKHLYVDSSLYFLDDKTNRHGILHGQYADKDYGKPINFYKAIATIDFLCFISAFRASISWLAPPPTEFSKKLSAYYEGLIRIASVRPKLICADSVVENSRSEEVV